MKQTPRKFGTMRHCFARGGAIGSLLSLLGIVIALLVACAPIPLFAQEEIGSYTVQSGDTLAVIADQFGVSLEQLIAINNIADQNLISVGQVLLIPSADSTLNAVPTQLVLAKPGDTLVDVARRYGEDPQRITALNPLSMTTRLFPGQPVAVPQELPVEEALHFGAIDRLVVPTTLVQGRTGQVTIGTRRAISITANWNGLPLPFFSADATSSNNGSSTEQTENQNSANTGARFDSNSRTQIALLPAPALIAPAAYTLTIGYTTSHGIFLRQDRQIQIIEGPYDSQEIILPDEKGGLLAPEIAEDELALMIERWSTITPLRWSKPFTRPIGSQYATTSPFGTRRSYNGGPYSSYHAGQDFGAPAGVPIVAPAAGRIALAAPMQIRGNAILVDHGGGIFTGYWHVSELHVVEGQMVAAGDVLGLVGTTGLSTGAHLHWELRIYGIAVDPVQFLTEPLVVNE